MKFNGWSRCYLSSFMTTPNSNKKIAALWVTVGRMSFSK